MVYRGIMFQVDRGNTFAKSFKELSVHSRKVYLKKQSQKYYYQNNR